MSALQIVISGASECGLAVLERLLLDPELQFNYLTLLAPGGIKVSEHSCGRQDICTICRMPGHTLHGGKGAIRVSVVVRGLRPLPPR